MDRINNLIYYLLVVAVIFFGAYFFHSYLLAVAGGSFMLLPIISFVMLRLGSGNVKIMLDNNENRFKRGEELEFKATLINKGFMPVISCRFKMVFTNEYGGQPQVRYVESSVPAFGKRTVSFKIKPLLCGRIKAAAENSEIRDVFSFFKVRGRCSEHFVFDIMPVRKKIEVENTIFENAADDSDSMKRDTAGSDIIDVREYAPGDSLKSVHWKMSAKKDGLFVKERGEETKDSLILLFELTHSDINGTLDLVYSAARRYAIKGQSVKVCWAGSGSEQLESRIVFREEELYDLFGKIYGSMPSSGDGHSLSVARRQLSGGSVLYIKSGEAGLKVIDL